MKTTFLDVLVEIDQADLLDGLTTTEKKDALSTEIVEKHRTKAEQECREAGGRLVVDTAPQFSVSRGSNVLLGGDFILTASRWTVEVPESFDPAEAAARSR